MDSTFPVTASPLPIPSADACSPAAQPRTWVRKVYGGGAIAERCPSWCTATHANDQNSHLDDLTHEAPPVAMRLPMHVAGTDGPMAWPILSASIRQWPYEETAESRLPYVSFEPSPDEIIELDADGLAAVIAQIRAHAERLERVHAQLIQAVTEASATVTA